MPDLATLIQWQSFFNESTCCCSAVKIVHVEGEEILDFAIYFYLSFDDGTLDNMLLMVFTNLCLVKKNTVR